MLKFVDVIWGDAVPFDIEKKGLYMIYYGIFIKSVFIGVGRLVEKGETTNKAKELKLA